MNQRQRPRASVETALMAAVVLVAALVLSVIPNQAWAAVDCTSFLASNPTDPGTDFDNDGFTNFQECTRITLADASDVLSCVASPTNPNPPAVRTACLDPNTKDLFIIYAPFVQVPPDTRTSLLPVPFNPFGPVTAYGVTFNGLTALGVTVHQITPAQAGADRAVTTGQKAVRVAESLDANGTVLGYCQWGTPNGLDGCTIYTQRIKNFITSTCGTNAIFRANGDPEPGGVDAVFLAYTIHTFLHETGHTTGGNTGIYNSSYGGYHYKAGANTLMEQYVTYSAKGGKCKFNISTGWNTTLDPSTIRLTD